MHNIPTLITAALAARERAHAPYSGYHVGAAVLCDGGSIYSGCNIENASYGATVCAERVAIFKAISEGEQQICAVAIVGGPAGSEIEDYAYPCGICRQVMAEFCADAGDFTVVVAKSVDEYKVFNGLDELLPYAFGG